MTVGFLRSKQMTYSAAWRGILNHHTHLITSMATVNSTNHHFCRLLFRYCREATQKDWSQQVAAPHYDSCPEQDHTRRPNRQPKIFNLKTITYFVFVMHSWSDRRNCKRDVIHPIVKPVSPRMHSKTKSLIQIERCKNAYSFTHFYP